MEMLEDNLSKYPGSRARKQKSGKYEDKRTEVQIFL